MMPNSPLRFGALFLYAAALTICGQALANSDAAPAAGQSPFLGEWELDLTRMPDTYGPPPKRVTYAFEDIGSGQWLTKIDIAAPDGSVRHIAIRYRRDGRAVQGEGDTIDGDTAALNTPAPNVLVMNIAKDKKPGAVRVYVVSADGREMPLRSMPKARPLYATSTTSGCARSRIDALHPGEG